MPGPIVTQGDARKIGEIGLSPKSVDCVITSPPYFNLKRYNQEDTAEVGQNQTLEEYLDDLGEIFRSCLALTKETGVLWLIADTLRRPAEGGGLGQLEPLPFQLAEQAKKVGWRLQEVVIWEKNKTLPYSGQGKLRNLIEYVLLFTKGKEFKHRPFRLAERHGAEAEWLSGWPERYHPLGRRPSNAWAIPIPTQGMWAHQERLHFCPLPPSLVSRCIELTTDKGDLVLDPFAGIGTVPAQAEAMGRRGRGVELNPSFIQIFEERILPSFQAAWEKEAETRHLKREDQMREAETIMMLRSLKAGKELHKLLSRWANEKPLGTPAASVQSIVVEPPESFSGCFDVEEGQVGRPSVRLTLLAEVSAEEEKELFGDIEAVLKKPPFSTFGLDLSLRLSKRLDFINSSEGQHLFEFEQSRRITQTTPVTLAPGARMPRLLSTVPLIHEVEGKGESELDVIRKKAERALLEATLAKTTGIAELATELRLPQADVRRLLLEHGIDEAQQTFAFPFMPGQREEGDSARDAAQRS